MCVSAGLGGWFLCDGWVPRFGLLVISVFLVLNFFSSGPTGWWNRIQRLVLFYFFFFVVFAVCYTYVSPRRYCLDMFVIRVCVSALRLARYVRNPDAGTQGTGDFLCWGYLNVFVVRAPVLLSFGFGVPRLVLLFFLFCLGRGTTFANPLFGRQSNCFVTITEYHPRYYFLFRGTTLTNWVMVSISSR